MLQDGWVKVYRSIESWEWWNDGEMVKAFLSILFRCEPNPYKWRGIDMDAGTFVTTQEMLCDILKKTRIQVRTILSRLIQSGEITVRSNNHWSVISVVNWSKYQGNSQPIANQNAKFSQPQTVEEQSLDLCFDARDSQPIANQNAKFSQQIANRQKKEESTKEEIKIYKKQDLNSPPMVETDLLGNPVTESKKESILPFEAFWQLYGKKVDRQACEKAYAKISERDRAKIKEHVPRYVESTPEIKYRKHPLTYLHKASWNDDIIPLQTQTPTENAGNILHEYKFRDDESGTEKLTWDE